VTAFGFFALVPAALAYIPNGWEDTMRTRLRILGLLLPAAMYGQGQPPITCGALTTCAEVGSFIAAITDFRPVVMNTNNKSLTFRISFRNKLNRPLILG
jgi:hypothetical protein